MMQPFIANRVSGRFLMAMFFKAKRIIITVWDS